MPAKTTGRDWKLRITDILTCIEKIQAYTAGMTYGQFKNDAKTVDAVIRNLEVIGEAAGYIPKAIQDRYPDMGWLEMRGMRNIMVHEYFGVSLPIIWRTVTHDLPLLSQELRKLLEN
ncbi:MAG TPA: DUF86 domain-containing protein [Anaerolineaceae bacterium]|nr:MAG: hypothetical protein A2X24_04970 [Chloroflexi bacterium GWB2_54_36]HAL17866.1 DUF86 domain-containing protein [Anaerolineaceae bacterium]